MSNTGDDKKRQPRRRNPFGSVISYLPIAGAVTYGGLGMAREIKANAGTFATPPTISKNAAQGIKNMRAKSAAAASASVRNAGPNAKKMILESLGGSFGDDSVKRLALSYAAMVSDPSVSLSKEHMTSSLMSAQKLVNKTLGVRGDRTAYALEMSNMVKKMSDHEAEAFHKKWEMVSPANFESNYVGFRGNPLSDIPRRGPDLGGMSRPVSPVPPGRLVSHIDMAGQSTFYRDLGFLGPGKSTSMPDNWKSSPINNQKRSLKKFGLTGIDGVKSTELSRLTHKKGKFFDLEVNFHGSRNPFRFILSGTGGHRVISPKSMGSFIVGSVKGEEGAGPGTNLKIKELIHTMAGMSPLDRARAYREFYETQYKIGQFESGGIGGGSAGQKLSSALARNTIWDPAALERQPGPSRKRAYYGLRQMEAFMKANPGFEAVSPGSMTKGGFIDMKNFRVAGRKETFNLMELYKGQESYDRSNRLFQVMRELSWTPTRNAVASWGVSGVDDLKDLEKLRKVKMGPAGALERFRPVNAGATFDSLLIKEMGYVTPGAIVLGELGGADKAMKESTKEFLNLNNLGDGEAFIRQRYADQLSFSRTVKYDIAAHGGQGAMLPMDDAAQALLQKGQLSPEEYAKAIRRQIKEAGGALRLSSGTPLGLGIGVEAGKLVSSSFEGTHVNESITGATLSHDGYIRLHVRQDLDAIEGLKFFGGSKNTAKIRSNRFFDKLMNSLMDRSSGKVTGYAQEVRQRNMQWVDQVSGTLPIAKHLHGAHEQMVSGLRIVSGMELLEKRRTLAAINKENAVHIDRLASHRKAVSKILGGSKAGMSAFNESVSFGISLIDFQSQATKIKSFHPALESKVDEIMAHLPAYNQAGGKRIVNPLGGGVEEARHHRDIARSKIRRSLIASAEATKKLYSGNAEARGRGLRTGIEQLEKFLDPKHFGKMYDRGDITKSTIQLVKNLGLKDHGFAGRIFGGMHAFLSKSGRETELDSFEKLLKSELGTGMLESARKQGTIGQAFNYGGDMPYLAQGRMGSVESRSLDMLLTRTMKVNGENLTEAVVRDLYGATASPAAVGDYSAISRMFWSMIGDHTPNAGLERVDLASQDLSEITASRWFNEGEGVVVKMPKEYSDTLKKMGMSDAWEIPGQRATSEFAGSFIDEHGVRSAGFARTASGELQAKTYRDSVQSIFELLSPEGHSGEQTLESRLHQARTITAGMYNESRKALTRGKLGAGSSFAQASSLGDLQQQLARGMGGALADEGLGKYIDKVYTPHAKGIADPNTSFISRKLANRLVGDIERSGIIMPESFDKAAFLKGEAAWYGTLARPPAVYQTSLVPVRIAVHHGAASSSIENIKVSQDMVKVMINGEAEMLDLGIGPGMGADFDKDMLSIKLATDDGLARMLSSTDAFKELDAERRMVNARQHVMNVEVKKAMHAWGKSNPQIQAQAAADAANPILTQLKKLFIAKSPGKTSRALEEVKYAMLVMDVDEATRSKAFSLFSAVEEAATIKAKHLPSADDFGKILTDALYGKGGKLRPSQFLGVLRDIFVKESGLSSGVDVSIEGAAEKIIWNEADEAAVHNAMTNYAFGDDGINKKVFDQSRATRSLSFEDTVAAARYAKAKGISGSDEIANVLSQINRESTMAGFVEEALGKLNLNTKSLNMIAKQKNKIGGLVLAGLAGTSALQSLFGSPGYSSVPLGGGEGLDPRVLSKMRDGNLLNMRPRKPITPQDVAPQGQGQPNGTIHTPSARISGTGTSMRSTVRGDAGASDIDAAIQQYRQRRPGAGVRTHITDRRGPLYPSQMDR